MKERGGANGGHGSMHEHEHGKVHVADGDFYDQDDDDDDAVVIMMLMVMEH